MSRIGKLPISVPAGVTLTLKDDVVTVKGPKGELSQYVHPSIKTIIEDGQVTFEIDEKNPEDVKQKQAYHGLYRSLVNNGCRCKRGLLKDFGTYWCWLSCF